MRSFTFLVGVSVLAVAGFPPAQEPDVLRRAAALRSVNVIKTLEFKASGVNFTVGQNSTPNDPWPPVTIKSYRTLINYESGGMRASFYFEMSR
jgi:hypothetical protein